MERSDATVEIALPVALRLAGEVDGEERGFFLRGRERLTVGSSPASDVHLPVRGVSREHAVLRAVADALTVEDRGSTNGTFVDGVRVERSAVAVGGELRFGPVTLTLERLAGEEAELAVVLPAGDGVRLEAPGPESATAWLAEEVRSGAAARWLRALDAAETEPGRTLETMAEALPAEGLALVEWVGVAPAVVSARGVIGELPPLAELRSRGAPGIVSGETSPDGVTVVFGVGEPPWAVALLDGSPRELPTRALVVWGSFPGRLGCGPLLRLVLRRLLRRLAPAARPAAVAFRSARPPLVFPEGYQPGVSPAMRALYRQLERLLRGDLPVLVVGETGAGKEMAARILHASGERRDQPFVAINCAAIPTELQEAELFGIARGVATGVVARRGKLEMADGGILFLDEVGDMAPALQVKMLRALQEREIQPLGGAVRSVDVRIVAATNADLSERIRSGAFRSDLYYRLAGYVLEVPPLRHCREDLPVLVEKLLGRFARETGTTIHGVTVAAMRRLQDYRWPGNVRELAHEMRRLAYLADPGQVIETGMLQPAIRRQPASPGGDPQAPLALEPQLRELETRLIREALAQTGGVQLQAARLLGIHRNSLTHKMKRLGVDG